MAGFCYILLWAVIAGVPSVPDFIQVLHVPHCGLDPGGQSLVLEGAAHQFIHVFLLKTGQPLSLVWAPLRLRSRAAKSPSTALIPLLAVPINRIHLHLVPRDLLQVPT